MRVWCRAGGAEALAPPGGARCGCAARRTAASDARARREGHAPPDATTSGRGGSSRTMDMGNLTGDRRMSRLVVSWSPFGAGPEIVNRLWRAVGGQRGVGDEMPGFELARRQRRERPTPSGPAPSSRSPPAARCRPRRRTSRGPRWRPACPGRGRPGPSGRRTGGRCRWSEARGRALTSTGRRRRLRRGPRQRADLDRRRSASDRRGDLPESRRARGSSPVALKTPGVPSARGRAASSRHPIGPGTRSEA